jgi:RimJ/RimL family protein N-acetyltransferase
MISLMRKADDNRGFWLDPAWQGRGLMSEACNAVTGFWFDTLGQEVLRVPKASGNAASRAISEKGGMRVIWRGERDFVSGRLAAELWEITADEWRQQQLPVPEAG